MWLSPVIHSCCLSCLYHLTFDLFNFSDFENICLFLIAINLACQQSPEEAQAMLMVLLQCSLPVLGKCPELSSNSGTGLHKPPPVYCTHQPLSVCFSHPSSGKTLHLHLTLLPFGPRLRGVLFGTRMRRIYVLPCSLKQIERHFLWGWCDNFFSKSKYLVDDWVK